MDLRFESLTTKNAGVEDAFQQALVDVLQAVHDQEDGERREGPIKVTLTVNFERRDTGVLIAVDSAVAVPRRTHGKGRYASLTPDGKLLVDCAVQPDLPYDDGVVKIRKETP